MTLSSSSSVSSLRSAAGHHFPSTRLAPIEESKYEKHRQQQKEDQRRVCLLLVLLIMALWGLWHLLMSNRSPYPFIHHSSAAMDDQVIQSLRRNPNPRPHGGQGLLAVPKEKHIHKDHQNNNGGMYRHQQQQQQQQQQQYDQRRHHHNNYDDQQQQHPIQPDTKSREERLEQAIQELKNYQSDAGTREREYQNEIKAQLEDELKKNS